MTNSIAVHGRAPFDPIEGRRALQFPGGVRLVVWFIVNVEHWNIERSMPRQVLAAPTGRTVAPDLPNWAWHEYGMRVGFWRIKRVFDQFGIKPTLSINARVCDTYEAVPRAALDAGWDFMAHGLEQRPIHDEPDEAHMIGAAMDRLEKFCGARPSGWLGPGLTETFNTPEYLAEHGVRYVGDWVIDDEPVIVATDRGPLVSLPYTLELNDIVVYALQHGDGAAFAQRVTDQFDTLYDEAADRAKILSIALHPYLSGVPHRIGYLSAIVEKLASEEGVEFWTGSEITDWFLQSENA